jgi:hypothetical protein
MNIPKKYFIDLVLIIFCLSYCDSIAQKDNKCIIPLNENWQPETWTDTKGITHVEYDSLNDALILHVNLKGKDPNLSKGEVFLDLRWLEEPCIDSTRNTKNQDFLDLSDKKLSVTMEIPKEFIGSRSAPNGIQLFAKSSDNFDVAYSNWKNVEKSGQITVALAIKNGPFGYKKRAYNPKYCASIGIKVAINSASRYQFKGLIRVKKVEIL